MDPGSHGGFAEVLGVWCAFVVRAGHLYCCVFYRCTKQSVFYFTHGLILIRIGHVLSREVGKDMVHLSVTRSLFVTASLLHVVAKDKHKKNFLTLNAFIAGAWPLNAIASASACGYLQAVTEIRDGRVFCFYCGSEKRAGGEREIFCCNWPSGWPPCPVSSPPS